MSGTEDRRTRKLFYVIQLLHSPTVFFPCTNSHLVFLRNCGKTSGLIIVKNAVEKGTKGPTFKRNVSKEIQGKKG